MESDTHARSLVHTAAGAKLILSSRRREALLAVRTEIVSASRGSVGEDDIKIVTLDLEHVDSMREVARVAITSFGKVFVYVCAAERPRAIFTACICNG